MNSRMRGQLHLVAIQTRPTRGIIAIKAVEELLIPMVLPNKPKANLGGVAGELGGPASHKWKLTPSTSSEKGRRWQDARSDAPSYLANPDRHGGGGSRAPTQPEAERVVHLSVAIIELCRAGGCLN